MSGVSRELIRAVLEVRDHRHNETHAALVAIYQVLAAELLDAGVIKGEALAGRLDAVADGITPEVHGEAARDLVDHIAVGFARSSPRRRRRIRPHGPRRRSPAGSVRSPIATTRARSRISSDGIKPGGLLTPPVHPRAKRGSSTMQAGNFARSSTNGTPLCPGVNGRSALTAAPPSVRAGSREIRRRASSSATPPDRRKTRPPWAPSCPALAARAPLPRPP